MSYIFDIFVEEIEIIGDAEGIIPSLVFQAMHSDQMHHSFKNGGNSMGFDGETGSLVVFLIPISWKNPEGSKRIHASAVRLMDKSVAKAKELDSYHRFVYQNYANISQDVFEGYRKENRQKLKKIKEKWDPQGLFAKLQNGYFKV